MTHTNHQHLPNLLDLADSALRPLDGLADLRLAHPLLCHRHPHLANAVDAMARIGRLQGQGYRLIGAFDGNRLAAVAGYRFQENLLFGRFLSLEDLITADTHQVLTGVAVSYWDLNDSRAPRATCAWSWSATVASPAQKTVTDVEDSSPHRFATANC